LDHSIGECIAAARKAKGWSQQDLADAAGVGNKSTVSRWERGEGLSPERVAQLENLLDVTLEAGWHNGDSREAKLAAAITLDWCLVARACCLLDTVGLNMTERHRAAALKQLYVLGIKNPSRLTEDAAATIAHSIS
jgi:transcriptional regulator with XRE-family HTH domain